MRVFSCREWQRRPVWCRWHSEVHNLVSVRGGRHLRRGTQHGHWIIIFFVQKQLLGSRMTLAAQAGPGLKIGGSNIPSFSLSFPHPFPFSFLFFVLLNLSLPCRFQTLEKYGNILCPTTDRNRGVQRHPR